ncbi:LAETG motif-containing sortase-dependent surface protein [Streptomyces tagetis]|uniref:LPXTG cell wall anchor domain-containing protein n=1 Tax=Streptomyces tagetis TaxID=2820809 RepID=A0A940XHK6_9ACTN|nr:LAETG motif-containing sortase-dependent surface protein [Streptomyces sp. RG38]MBQ0827557.1 LPXTG cell wall anchor domain-containing protein [Streptomyces sp. RG38]
MSIARRVTMRRLLGTGAASLALCAASVAGASGALAHGTPGGDGWNKGGSYKPGSGAGTATGEDRCQFSLDGTDFRDSVEVDDQSLRPTQDGKVRVWVRAARGAGSCTASLSSFLAHGPTFATSGEQVFVDFSTATVKPGETGTLDIAVPDAGCFAQIDLYRGAVRFDGKTGADDGFEHGELPKGPDRPVIKDKLIAAWNGGTKDCTTPAGEKTDSPQPDTSQPGTPETTRPAPATPSDTPESGTPSAGAPSEAPDGTPSASASQPVAGSDVTPDGSTGNLAETGADSNTGPVAIGAAVLLIGGMAIVVATRRRNAAGS